MGKKEANTERDVHEEGPRERVPKKWRPTRDGDTHVRAARKSASQQCYSSRRARESERVSWNVSRCGRIVFPRIAGRGYAGKKQSLIWERHVSRAQCRRDNKIFSRENNAIGVRIGYTLHVWRNRPLIFVYRENMGISLI